MQNKELVDALAKKKMTVIGEGPAGRRRRQAVCGGRVVGMQRRGRRHAQQRHRGACMERRRRRGRGGECGGGGEGVRGARYGPRPAARAPPPHPARAPMPGMDCIPRTISRAQTFDALSSMANIAG